ncbi:ABC transporter permease [Algiphilus sp.]|uniref:MlaE family ABC transporter permease n=1 Tax=Algiphilus sp. TaxID=1872431 RepID=UPI002A5DDD89|nr:ABC transporter permease [Pseudomonadota bacterium]
MSAQVEQHLEQGTLHLQIAGQWRLGHSPDSQRVLPALRGARVLRIEVAERTQWDSALPAFLTALLHAADRQSLDVQLQLPRRLEALLALARQDAAPPQRRAASALRLPDLRPPLRFVGALLLALQPGARALPQGRELLRILRQTSVQSVPIIILVNFLVGAILAFIGVVQLRTFGAEIYVADLVGIATAREMAALITAVVLSGRIAASFAAEIATMQANEEIDALRTAGVDPIRYLAVPRVLALVLAMPVLFFIACMAALLGGLVVATLMIHLPASGYLTQTREMVSLTQVMIGFGKSLAFAAYLSATGCYYGLRAPRTAAGVGDATTRAVVGSIIGIICIDAVVAVICNALGI